MSELILEAMKAEDGGFYAEVNAISPTWSTK